MARISPTLSITMDPRVKTRLDERVDTDSGGNLSRQISADLQTFYALIDAEGAEMRGILTANEACFLCDVMNGTFMDTQQLRGWSQSMAWSIEDGASLDGLDKKWKTDTAVLAEKLRNLTPAQAVWVWDRIQMFWRDPNRKPIQELAAHLFLTEAP